MIDQFKRRTVLNQAADLILEPDRWTSGTYTTKIGGVRAYCAVGAIRAVMGDAGAHWRGPNQAEFEVLEPPERLRLMDFNDRAHDAQDVAKRLRKMAAELP